MKMDFHTLRDEKEAQFRQEEEELRKSTESNEAKIVKLNQDLMSLEVSHDTAAQSNASLLRTVRHKPRLNSINCRCK